MIDAEGYLHILSRVDDIIKVAGHRLATGSIEEALAAHPSVAECAVIAVEDVVKGEVPLGLVVLKSGVTKDHDTIVAECVEARAVNSLSTVIDLILCDFSEFENMLGQSQRSESAL